MAARSERRDITALHHASNGPGESLHDTGKKRLRDEDAGSGESSRRRLISGPYGGVAQDSLRMPRAKSGRTLKRDHSPKIASAGSHSSTNKMDGPLSRKVFPDTPRSGILEDSKPASVHSSIQAPAHHSSTIQPLPQGLSEETSVRMDGEGGGESDAYGSLSLARIFMIAGSPPPDTPKREENESKAPEPTPSGRQFSSDPINLIDSGDETKPEEDDIVEYDPPPASEPPRTPKGKTRFSAGLVKNQVEKLETPRQTTLASYLQTMPTSQPAKSAQTATKSTVTGKGPSGTGAIIIPGMTRPSQPGNNTSGKISKRMGTKSKPTKPAKPAKPTTNLVIQNQGHSSAPVTKPASRLKIQEKSALVKHKLELQEWYCGAEHHESNKSKYSYELTFDQVKLVITSFEGKQQRRTTCLMRGEVKSFQVVAMLESEVYPWLILFLNPKVLNKHNWKLDGLGDSNQVLLHFNPDSDGIHDTWEGFIQDMARWTQKEVLKQHAMDGLIKHITDQSVFFQSKEPRSQSEFVAPKIQDSNDPSRQRDLGPELQAPAKPSSSKPRTRSTVFNSNQGDREEDSNPTVVQDPDEVVLVHPTGTGSVTINRGELARLEPGEFLNDTLIELGLKMWLNDLRVDDPTVVDQIHIFSSFFFKKLDAGRGKGCDYNSVKKWTSKFDLFSKKFIIIPINEHLHWYLAIICFPEHILEASLPQPSRVTRSSDVVAKTEQRMSPESDMQVDQTSLIDVDAGSPTELGKMEIDTELADKSGKMAIDSSPPESQPDVANVDSKPKVSPIVDATNDDSEGRSASQDANPIRSEKTWVLILDSLGGKHPRTVRILKEYLQAEAQERRGKAVDLKDNRSSGGLVEDKHLSVPVQPNWCDCGVYLLHYVEVFYANPLEIITLPSNAKRKGKEASNRYDELWKTNQVKDKRTVFREKLHELSAKWLEAKYLSLKNTAPVPGTLPPIADSTPLPHLEADASILEIEPPDIRDVPTAATEFPVSLELRYPPPPLETISPSTTMQEAAEVETLVHPETLHEVSSTVDGSPIDVSSNSSRQSFSSKSTRRGKKSGPKHGPRLSLEHSANPVSEHTESPIDLTAERAVSVDL